MQVTAAARENGDLTRRGLTVRSVKALLRDGFRCIAADNITADPSQESGRRMFGTAGEFDIDGRFVSAMDRLRVDESMPLSDQATFSLVFDLIAFGVSVNACIVATPRNPASRKRSSRNALTPTTREKLETRLSLR
jgi:hypothetical protein